MKIYSLLTRLSAYILTTFALKHLAVKLYDRNPLSKVLHTENYFLSKSMLSAKFDSEAFLFPFHIFLLNLDFSPNQFSEYCNFLLILGTFLCIVWWGETLSFFWGIWLGFFLMLSPVYIIQINWIGFSDHLFFPIIIAWMIVLSQEELNFWNKIVFALLTILGSYTHFYQFMIATFSILFLHSWFNHEWKISKFLSLIILFLISKLSIELLFPIDSLRENFDRLNFARSHSFLEWLMIFSTSLIGTIYSLFQGTLFLFLKELILNNVKLLLVGFSLLFITVHTLDTTRVFAHLFYPAWIYALYFQIQSKDFNNYFLYSILLLLGAISYLLIHPMFKWDSKLYFL
jgi:hypothetical protein